MLYLFGVQFKRVFGELETLLNERGQLTDTASLLAENFLGVGGADDDLTKICGPCWDETNESSTSVRA